jgi:hypothetical protein
MAEIETRTQNKTAFAVIKIFILVRAGNQV